jgi:hypothetical protein
MKKKAFLTGILGMALVFTTLLFVGCKDEEDNPFEGTTWVSTYTEQGMTITATLSFTSDSAFSMTMTTAGVTPLSFNGTYTYSGNTATLTMDGDSSTATISGNTLTTEGMTFTKQ